MHRESGPQSQGWGKFVSDMVTGQPGGKNMQVEWDSATMRTVSFNLQGNPSVTSVPIKCEALITFAIEGNSFTRRISVVNGCSISAVAQSIQVELTDHTTVPGFPGALGEQYSVDILTSPGTRAFGHQPPILQQQAAPITIIGPAGFHDFPIPPDSGATSVYVTADFNGSFPPAGDITIIESSNGFTTAEWDYTQFAGQWVPLSPGATVVSVTVGAGTWVVTLKLGIDG